MAYKETMYEFYPGESITIPEGELLAERCITTDHVQRIRTSKHFNPDCSQYGSMEKIRKNKSPIEKVIFNNPATIICWRDGTKTVVKVQDGDEFDEAMGFAMCCTKKLLGNKSNFNNEFKKWVNEDSQEDDDMEIGDDDMGIGHESFATILKRTQFGFLK